jgi:3-deoxy-manno-octulosonate cytidylyltransferase (CMP-KDO synthetase)
VNVQGDEPFLDPDALRTLVRSLADQGPDVAVVNAYSPIASEEDFRSVTVPKVVMDVSKRLLYMSRGAIPTTKALEFRSAHRQIGMYAFRGDALARFAAHGTKTPLEQLEDIEILRFVELGMTVHMIEVPSVGIAIDTPDDLERARVYLASLR